MSYNSRVAFAINSLPRETLQTTKEQKTLSLAFGKDKIAALFFTTQSEVFAQGQAYPSALDEFAIIAIGTKKQVPPELQCLSARRGKGAEAAGRVTLFCFENVCSFSKGRI